MALFYTPPKPTRLVAICGLRYTAYVGTHRIGAVDASWPMLAVDVETFRLTPLQFLSEI